LNVRQSIVGVLHRRGWNTPLRVDLGLDSGSRRRRSRADSELQRREFRPVGFLLLALAVRADEVEVVLLGVFFLNAKAAAMLPYITLLTCNAVTPVIQVLAMHTTTRAVEDPMVLFIKLCQVLLRPLHLSLEMPRRDPTLATLQLLLLSRKAFNLGFV
jgi:hypothetical protein